MTVLPAVAARDLRYETIQNRSQAMDEFPSRDYLPVVGNRQRFCPF